MVNFTGQIEHDLTLCLDASVAGFLEEIVLNQWSEWGEISPTWVGTVQLAKSPDRIRWQIKCLFFFFKALRYPFALAHGHQDLWSLVFSILRPSVLD